MTMKTKKPSTIPERPKVDETAKDQQMAAFRRDSAGQYLTTNQGVRVNHDDDSLKAGPRGPVLLQDHLREHGGHLHVIDTTTQELEVVRSSADGSYSAKAVEPSWIPAFTISTSRPLQIEPI